MPEPKTAVLALADHPHRITETIRFGDTDRLGHVNNAVFATYFEMGRTALFFDPERPTIPAAGRGFILAHLAIDFRAELRWPGRVDIGTGVVKLGTSSFTLRQAVFKDGMLAATATAVMVAFDLDSRRPVPLPEATRRALDRLALTAPE